MNFFKKIAMLSAAITMLGSLSCFTAQASKLEIHMVTPPNPIDWSSPGRLFQSTLGNSWYNDYAPNGHYMVYFVHDNPKLEDGVGADGVKRILTGISRTNKTKTMIQTIKKQLGLSALEYIFTGTLDKGEAAADEIKKSRLKGRVVTFKFDISDAQADRMEAWLGKFIKYGSFNTYGGNLNTAAGEGSGCADFAMVFMNMATDGQLPLRSWIRDVYLPKSLKLYDDDVHKEVRLLKLIFTKEQWATPEEGVLFSTPDPDLMSDWLRKRTKRTNPFKRIFEFNQFDFYNKSNDKHQNADKIANTVFEQPEENIISDKAAVAMWDKISIDKPLEQLIAERITKKDTRKIRRALRKYARKINK